MSPVRANPSGRGAEDEVTVFVTGDPHLLAEAHHKLLALPAPRASNPWWWPLRRLVFGG